MFGPTLALVQCSIHVRILEFLNGSENPEWEQNSVRMDILEYGPNRDRFFGLQKRASESTTINLR